MKYWLKFSSPESTVPQGVVPPAQLFRVPSTRVPVGSYGTFTEIVTGPARDHHGRVNLAGALGTSMAACGYESVKDFQKAELVVAGPDAGSASDDRLGLL